MNDRRASDAMEKLDGRDEKTSMDLVNLVLELALQNLDPEDRVQEYLEAAKNLLEQAEEELGKGDVRQAAEKLWGAAALVIKAYAIHRDGRRLTSHGDLWEYMGILEKELGEWAHNAWMNATSMHVCLYEGWCAAEDVEKAAARIKKLVSETEKKIKN